MGSGERLLSAKSRHPAFSRLDRQPAESAVGGICQTKPPHQTCVLSWKWFVCILLGVIEMRNDVIMRWASLLILSVLAVGYTGNAFAQAAHTPQLAFEVKLNGDQVLPEVFSNMTAEARFTFDEGMRFAKVFMKVRNNFFGVTGVSLYLGEAGKNGEEVAVIEVLDPEVMTRTFTIAEVINSTEVVKVDSVTNIASLYQAVRDGRVYCIVTSLNYPEGEVRGQIFPR